MVLLRTRRRNSLYYIVLAGLLAVVWVSYKSFDAGNAPAEKPLSQLLTTVDNKEVRSATFTTDGDRIDWADRQGHRYRTLLTGGYVSSLVNALHDDQVPFDVTPSSQANLWLTVVLPNVILLLIIGGFMWYMLRRSQQQKIS